MKPSLLTLALISAFAAAPAYAAKEDQKRLSQTFVLKGLYRFDNGDALKATAMYSPHESKYLRASTKDGSYTNSGGGYRFNLEWKHLFDKGQVSTYLGV